MRPNRPEVETAPVAVSRRHFLAGLASFVAVVALAPDRALASAEACRERHLSFHHTHTGEKLSVCYWDGDYRREGLSAVNDFLRDFRTGDRHPIDPALLDQLHELRLATGSSAPFQVISGYRSPRTNDALRSRGGSQARRSLHMDGRAIDVRLADVPTAKLRDAALRLARGGVGYYPGDGFVHVDTGPFRRW